MLWEIRLRWNGEARDKECDAIRGRKRGVGREDGVASAAAAGNVAVGMKGHVGGRT